MYDNGKGNKSPVPISLRYCDIFSNLRKPLMIACSDKASRVPIESASALWCALALHCTMKAPMTQISTVGSPHRFLYVDNFYTRHVLAQKLFDLTGGEIFTTGTVRFSLVDTSDKKPLVKP